jgi:hypothetical protein
MTSKQPPPGGGATRFKPKPGAASKAVARKPPSRLDVEARRIVRAEMERRDVSYKVLVKLMNARAEPDEKVTERNLISRINRGTFTFSFLLQVVRALGIARLNVGEPE